MGFDDGILAIWNVDALEEAPVVLRKPTPGSVTTVAWSPDGTHLVFGTSLGTVILIDRDGDSVTVCTREGFSCSSVTFSPDNVWIIAAVNQKSGRHRIMFQVNPWLDEEFLPEDGSFQQIADPAHEQAAITAMQINRYGSELITGFSDGLYAIWKFGKQLSFSTPNSRAPFAVKQAEVRELLE